LPEPPRPGISDSTRVQWSPPGGDPVLLPLTARVTDPICAREDMQSHNDEVSLLLMRAEHHRGNHAAPLPAGDEGALGDRVDRGEELIRLAPSP
jgi:hypothetical protein